MPSRSSFDPWNEKGIPLDQQYRSWKQRLKKPYHKFDVDPYTRTRVILMNGIENEAWNFNHTFARMTGDMELKKLLARTRMVEQQQQTTINWLNPADQSVLETTIAFEQVATDLTAYLARNEPDPYLREAMHFGLLEDFDHLYRYAELLDLLEDRDADEILQGRTEVLPARPTAEHHNDPELRVRKHYEKNRAHPISKLHVLTVLSAEQQTYAYYASHGYQFPQREARELYAEIGEVEEEHVTHYESLLDPTETLIERQIMHELCEVYNYYHCYEQEPDPRIREIWEEFLAMEVTHLQTWGEIMQRYEGRDPQELFDGRFQVDFRFEENKEYIRQVLDKQRDVRQTADGWAMKDDLPADWLSHAYQEIVNGDGVPSDQIVEVQTSRDGRPGDDLLQRAREVEFQLRKAS